MMTANFERNVAQMNRQGETSVVQSSNHRSAWRCNGLTSCSAMVMKIRR